MKTPSLEKINQMVYQEVKEVIPSASKYFRVFFKIFSDKKINTKRKISNINALIEQLRKDNSIPRKDYYVNGYLKMGRDEEAHLMAFTNRLLDRRMTLATVINGYETTLT